MKRFIKINKIKEILGLPKPITFKVMKRVEKLDLSLEQGLIILNYFGWVINHKNKNLRMEIIKASSSTKQVDMVLNLMKEDSLFNEYRKIIEGGRKEMTNGK